MRGLYKLTGRRYWLQDCIERSSPLSVHMRGLVKGTVRFFFYFWFIIFLFGLHTKLTSTTNLRQLQLVPAGLNSRSKLQGPKLLNPHDSIILKIK